MSGYILIAVMAMLNACMDAWENTPNYNESIFKTWNPKFWCKDVSWQHARNLWGYKVDSWHLAKSLLVICIAILPSCEFRGSWWVIMINVGATWNLTFTLFYHFIFRIK